MLKKVISAPIRWTGSKRKLLNEMIDLFDKNKKIYIEPFLGSGVVLINVLEQGLYDEYYVNDVNENLILFYNFLQKDVIKLFDKINSICKEYEKLKMIEEKERYYYHKRKQFNEKRINKLTRAGIFWFLMKGGYNGVYRINSKGKFNVPFGKKEKLECDLQYFLYLSEVIKKVKFFNLDIQEFLNKLSDEINLEQAFIYLDPPYIPETNSSQNHILYTQNRFSHCEFLEYLKKNNFFEYSLMISMSKSEEARDIYLKYIKQHLILNDYMRKVNPKKILKSTEEIYYTYLIDCEKNGI